METKLAKQLEEQLSKKLALQMGETIVKQKEESDRLLAEKEAQQKVEIEKLLKLRQDE